MDQIGSDMVLDGYDDKAHVAIITPDDTDDAMDDLEATPAPDSDPEPEPEPRADEFDAFFQKHLPTLPDQETDTEIYHTWEIKDWRSLNRREHGPIIECGGHPWRILFFPYGNNVDYASFYLEHAYEDQQMPEDWSACLQFMIVLWNPQDPSMYITHTANHRFTPDEGDWGFTRFAELRRLFANSWDDRGRPMVEDNACNVTAYIRAIKDTTGVLWHNFINYDSKKETGMVGLKNQGATCYLNSLLQSLFFTQAFRQAVYQIPTAEESDRVNSAYALQRLFYLLQTSAIAVGTTDLTLSFGWDSKQIFEQQDVQELSRVLMDKLDERMKGTEAEGALTSMFVGKMKTYISCINVDYESSKTEDFWDIQLNVSGNKTLDDSFKDYIQVETMDGENKYFAEGFGLQEAKKGVIFESFPPVLHLQLKRFEYDFQRDAMMKVNDRYEFPDVWDAAPYLSDAADRSESWVYRLHGVLVHSGDLNAGHYYAFIKPTKDGFFYKFDDDRVTCATLREALEENFGGDYAPTNGHAGARNPYTRNWSVKRSMSAYMLVYIRDTRLDEILMDGKTVEPPKHLSERLAEEKATFERRKKEREEAHLYIEVPVASEDDFKAYQGFDIVTWQPGSENPAHHKNYKVLRSSTLAEFCKTIAQDLGVETDMLRPWSMVNRQNGTIRPDMIMQFPEMTIDEAAHKHCTKQTQFRLWMEKAEGRDESGLPIFGDQTIDVKSVSGNRPIMLFLKHFDIKTQSLLGVTTFYAAIQDKVSNLNPIVNTIMGWPVGMQTKLSEEIKQNMIEEMKPKTTLAQSEIQDGDIITVQQVPSEKEASEVTAAGGYVEAKDFYDYLLNRINVEFIPRLADSEHLPTFSLTLNKKMAYDQFASKVAEHLKIDAAYLRFTTVSTTGKAKQPIKYNASSTLASILLPSSSYQYPSGVAQRPDAMLYEVLDMSLKELEQRKPIKVTWLPEGLGKEEDYTLMVPKQSQVSDVLEALQKKANIDDDIMQSVRIYEVHMHRFHKALPSDHQIVSMYDYTQLYAAPFPEGDSSKCIWAFHYDKEPSKPHGTPFQVTLKEGEPFRETKQRISELIKIKGKQLDKIKFALVPKAQYSRPEYIQEDEIIFDTVGAHDDMSIGLEHPNKSKSFWGKTDSIFIR